MIVSFVKHRNWYYLFSGTLVILAAAAILLWGLKLGIDFTGGTLWEVNFNNPTQAGTVNSFLKDEGIKDIVVQQGDQNDVLMRIPSITEPDHQRIASDMKAKLGDFKEQRFDSVGPLIGKELQGKAFLASFIAVIGIFIYILIAFRKVERVTSVWKMSLATIIALVHDVIITVGVFAVLGRFMNVEVGLPFVAAVLTIFGYSVNDTVVVFDRIRENAMKPIAIKQVMDELIDTSLRQTLARSLITSLVVILSLLVIFIFGGESLRYFSLALLVGIGFGTYSSIFVASMLLSTFQKRRRIA
jgi:preprotein translocase subunit SecF